MTNRPSSSRTDRTLARWVPASSSKCARAPHRSASWPRAVSISPLVSTRAFERVMPRSQLLELYAHGLGVIQEARLEFGPGFNVLTGETGAGKTLLLGALDLCLGGDASLTRDAIASDMRCAAVFDYNGEREVVLTRESGASGRLRSAVDGASSSAEALRALAGELIVIHGQHDSLTLRNRSEMLRLVDAKGAVSVEALSQARRALQA